MTKPVFGVSYPARPEPVSPVPETSKKVEIKSLVLSLEYDTLQNANTKGAGQLHSPSHPHSFVESSQLSHKVGV